MVEVLSPSTEAFDRGEKFIACRKIASLRDWLLLSQHEPWIEHYARQSDGAWLLVTANSGDRVVITSLEIELEVDALYAGLEAIPD